MRVFSLKEKEMVKKCGSMSRIRRKKIEKDRRKSFWGTFDCQIRRKTGETKTKEEKMKTPILMAAIVAGFGLVSTGAQAQERPDFATLDTNGDGQITMAELTAQGEARFAAADTNGDGALSEAELLARASERADDRAAKMVERMLERLDENDDGLIQQTELPERDGDRAERRFERADANDDGVISEEEFETAAERGGKGRRGGHGGKGGERRGDNG